MIKHFIINGTLFEVKVMLWHRMVLKMILAFDFSTSGIEGDLYGKYEARAHKIEYFNMIFPVIKTKDNTIAFFNFGSDKIEFMDENGKTFRTVPIDFHKEIKSKQ